MAVAEVSGPAGQSKRTDLGVLKQSTQVSPATQPAQHYTGGPHGSNKATFDQGSSAALAGNPFASLPKINAISLDTPTQNLDEPGTAGIDMGPGGGSELMLDRPNLAPSLLDTLRNLIQFDASGDAELIYRQLLDDGQ